MKVIDKQLFEDTFQYFDNEIVVEIIDIFLNEYKDRLKTIKESIEASDFDKIKFSGHSLKGVVSNFAAPTVQAFAKKVEDQGTNGEDLSLTNDFVELEKLTLELAHDLKEIRGNFT